MELLPYQIQTHIDSCSVFGNENHKKEVKQVVMPKRVKGLNHETLVGLRTPAILNKYLPTIYLLHSSKIGVEYLTPCYVIELRMEGTNGCSTNQETNNF